MSDVGIVLAGGGGKGAYEVGVWIALQEILKELDLNVKAFSGASVGALNAALFACATPDEIEQIWSEVTPKLILQPKLLDCIAKLATGKNLVKLLANVGLMMSGIPNPMIFRAASFGTNAYNILSLLREGVFSRDGLKSIIDKAEVSNRINTFNGPIYASCFDKTSIRSGNNYIQLNGKNCIDTLMASAALPLIFGDQKVDDKIYYDGGIGDNMPIRPLIESEKITRFIAIHLGDNDSKSFENIDMSGCKIYHIFPQESFGVFDTLDFRQAKISKSKNSAEDDMQQQLKYINELKIFFNSSDSKEAHFVNGRQYSSVSEVYDSLKKKELVKARDKGDNKLKNIAKLIMSSEREITVDDKKSAKALLKLSSLGSKQFMVIVSVLAGALTIGVVSGGILAPAAVATFAPATAIIGIDAVAVLAGLVIATGSTKVLHEIRKYKAIEQDDGSCILVSEKYCDDIINSLTDKG